MHPQEVAARLGQLAIALDDLVSEYKELGEKAAAARRDFKKAKASSYLRAEGSIVARQAVAELQSADAGFDADIADVGVSACREAIKAMHARIDVGRTVSATLRDEMRLGGPGA
ncbi:MAG: hypothetical protein JWL97_3763 [Gemmatimonadales bacterium]|nr:hypothetical protein [Gemmatimonadales bacterium]